VLIPAENVDDLMLRDDVVQAVTKGEFRIYPVGTVEQGIEILLGVSAGKRNAAGKFTPGSVFAKVDDRLHKMAKLLGKFD
jgi:predicted ATP-dependent protease